MEKVIVDLSGTVTHVSGNPVKIEVNRGVKGGYGWTITMAGTDPGAIRAEIKEIDAVLRVDFPGPEGG